MVTTTQLEFIQISETICLQISSIMKGSKAEHFGNSVNLLDSLEERTEGISKYQFHKKIYISFWDNVGSIIGWTNACRTTINWLSVHRSLRSTFFSFFLPFLSKSVAHLGTFLNEMLLFFQIFNDIYLNIKKGKISTHFNSQTL